MRFDKSIVEIIEKRTSRRTYVPKLLNEDVRKRVSKLINVKELRTPFSDKAGKCRFGLISMPEFDPKEKKKLGTYGIIKGAQEFIVGAVEKSDYMKEHFGYLMEGIILAATDMELGTCWLGGFFNRTLFSEKISASSNEILPAISPIGYSDKRRPKEVIIRQFIKADNRHQWDRLFYEEDFFTPLSSDLNEGIITMLKMVQKGPSSGNQQPWRIIKERERNVYHFYSKRSEGIYQSFYPLDIGIATCHWDLTSHELGIKGEWEIDPPNIPGSENLDYKISWKQK